MIGTCFAAPARGELIVNGGFEEPYLPDDGPTAVVFSPGEVVGVGWEVLGASGSRLALGRVGYEEPTHPAVFNIFEGRNAVDLTGPGTYGPDLGIRQAVATEAGVRYELSFSIGRLTMVGGPAWPYISESTANLSINGGPLMAFTNSDVTEGYVNWKRFTYTFIAAGASTTISFFNGTDGDNGAILLDAVSMTAVPEPSSALLAMLAIGGPLLLRARQRVGERRRIIAAASRASLPDHGSESCESNV